MQRKTAKPPKTQAKPKPKKAPGSKERARDFMRRVYPKYLGTPDDPFLVMGEALSTSAAPKRRGRPKKGAGSQEPAERYFLEEDDEAGASEFSVRGSRIPFSPSRRRDSGFFGRHNIMDEYPEEEEPESVLPEPQATRAPSKNKNPQLLKPPRNPQLHRENLEAISVRLITWKSCPKADRENFALTIFRELERGSPEIISRLLLRTGFSQMQRDQFGRRPIHVLAQRGKRFLDAFFSAVKNPNLEAGNANEDTAMHVCAFEGDVDSLKLLKEEGADVDAQNESLQTPLMLSALGEQEKASKALIALGADPTLEDRDKKNAAEYATLVGCKALSTYLKRRATAWKKKH